jgi:hypothetical protein
MVDVFQQYPRQRVGAVLLCGDQFRRHAVSGFPARAAGRPENRRRHRHRRPRVIGPIQNGNEADALFGVGSMLSAMFRIARVNAPFSRFG